MGNIKGNSMKALIAMTQFCELGGAEQLAIEMAVELNKKYIQTDVLSIYGEDLPGAYDAKNNLISRGVPNVYFLGIPAHSSLKKAGPSILKLRKLIKKNKYDIVETSMMLPTAIASWSVRGLGTRQVVGIHQVLKKDRENSLNHKFWRFSVKLNSSIRFYAISDFVLKSCVSYFNIDKTLVRKIYNAISDEFFEIIPDKVSVRNELNLPTDRRLAIYVGRLAAYKGIDTVFTALYPILKKHNITLLYVGRPDLFVSGTERVLQKINKFIADSQLNDHVKMLGYRNDIPRLMASSDVLVHPTRVEGFGLVLAEALATGLPVVASNVEGIPEVLQDSDSIVVSPDDPEALRDAVIKILERPSSLAKLAINRGKKKAEKFRMERRVSDMINLFDDIISGRF